MNEKSIVNGRDGSDCWLADDELTREWIQHVAQYRAECDAADRALINDSAPLSDERPSA